MNATKKQSRLLPSREFSYAYTVAMYFAQQLEIDLRAILYTADYHGWGDDIVLSKEELKRFESTENLIDKATCGLIIQKLRSTGILSGEQAWKAFKLACEYRNRLAHSFLAEHDFDKLTEADERKVIGRLEEMAVMLYQAVLTSRSVRNQVENLADQDDLRMHELFKEFGDNSENPNRHYATRTRKKK